MKYKSKVKILSANILLLSKNADISPARNKYSLPVETVLSEVHFLLSCAVLIDFFR